MVVVFPALPPTATTGPGKRSRTMPRDAPRAPATGSIAAMTRSSVTPSRSGEHRGRAGFERRGDEDPAVDARSLQRDEEIAGLDGPAVDRDAVDRDVRRASRAIRTRRAAAISAARMGIMRGAAPARARRRRRGRRARSPRRPPPGEVSGPLPAISTASPARASSSATRIASRRSGSTWTRSRKRNPERISAMIVAGFSDRGLSCVTTTTSAPRSATLAIAARLPR